MVGAGSVVTGVELAVLDERNDRLVVVSSSPRRPWGDLSSDDNAVMHRVLEVASEPSDLVPQPLQRRSLVLPIGPHLVTFSCAEHGRICVLWSRHGPGVLVQARAILPEAIELIQLADGTGYVARSFLDPSG